MNIIKENGRLTKEGELLVSNIKNLLLEIVDLDKVKNMQFGELKALESNLISLVKDIFSEANKR